MCLCVQVNVNILEAQKLVGVNINPAVFIRAGDQKKHTATQKSTNCPYYNEVLQRAVQYSTLLYSKIQCSRVEYSTVHFSTVQWDMV